MYLNGFKISLSGDKFHAIVKDGHDNTAVQDYRRRYGERWFFHWDGGKIYAIHKNASLEEAMKLRGMEEMSTADNLSLLAARLTNALPDVLTDCKPIQYRPFSWIKGADMMRQCLSGISNLPPVLNRFSIRPRYEIDSKVVELTQGVSEVALIFNRHMRWEIFASPHELEDAGVTVKGLILVGRRRQPGQSRLIGRIQSVENNTVQLSESYNDLTEVAEDDVWVEGTPASFSQCLRDLLGGQFERYQSNLERVISNYLKSDVVESSLRRVEEKLLTIAPIYLGGGISAVIEGRLEVSNSPAYKSIVQSPTVEYCFDAGRTKRDQLSWRGLARYGPFSRDTFPKKSPTIVVFFPDSIQRAVENYVSMLRDGIILPGGKESAYPGGMGQIYGLTNPKFVLRKIPWFGRNVPNPADAYRNAVETFLQEGQSADIALVALLDEHSDLPDRMNPYLYAKADLLMGGIPVQEIRLSKLMQGGKDLQYINQDLSVAMYAKMSGTPWTVDHDLTVNDEIVIGMGACEVNESRFENKKRYIGITTVFRGDGNYLLSNLSKECLYEEYPQELKSSTLAVLHEIKDRNGWRPGDTVRIVFHISKPLKNVEVADITAHCVKEMCGEQNIEFAFITVTQDHPYLLMDNEQRGLNNYGRSKGKYAPSRGTVVQLDTFQRLLATQGPNQIKSEKTGIPNPLLIKLHEQSSYRDLQALSEQVLRFTSMTWRSTRPAAVPVTILYSQEIAKLLVRLKTVEGWSPAVLRGKLKASRWFL